MNQNQHHPPPQGYGAYPHHHHQQQQHQQPSQMSSYQQPAMTAVTPEGMAGGGPQPGLPGYLPQQPYVQQQVPHAQQQQQQQLSSDEAVDPSATAVAAAAAQEGISKLKVMISGNSAQNQAPPPNLGFTPTAALNKKHEDAHVASVRPLYQFQVTKLRSWRTGYVRLLCLYKDHMSTFDPQEHKITNTWKYDALQDYVAVDQDQLLLQLEKDKLKFQCHNVDRSRVLTAILECRDLYLSNEKNSPPQDPVLLCQRPTRHGTVVPAALQLTPYAVKELHPTTKRCIRSYQYCDIRAISFTSDEPNGILFHFPLKTRLFVTSTQGRSDVVTVLRDHFSRIGLDLRMTESWTVAQWKEHRQQLGISKKVGPIATEWPVTKTTKRHNTQYVGSQGWTGGLVPRRLALTGGGYILEIDAVGVVNAHPLEDLYSIVRPEGSGELVLEFNDGSQRTYSCPNRDSLLVSILDAAATLGKNPKVHVSDLPSNGYCLASFATQLESTKTGGLFQPISIPVHCLKRVHNVATAAFSYINSTTESSTEEGAPMNVLDECRNTVEACRECNASVLPTAEGLPTSEKDKYVLGSIGALWGLVAEILERSRGSASIVDSRVRLVSEQAVAPMLQTLHRLSKTPAGYKHTIELDTFPDCLPFLLEIQNPFCKYWAIRTLTVLISGLPGDARNREAEFVNKNVVFKTGGPQFIEALVSTLLAASPSKHDEAPHREVSDMILMVTSDLLQSVLCSYYDTTTPEHFQAFIRALGFGYRALLSTLRCPTPFVIENAALLLHLLASHAPEAASAIREASLSSAILLQHFHAATFSPLEGQRFLSRFLCSLWLSGPDNCDEKKLLKRMVPSGFLGYLRMPQLSRAEEEQLDELERDAVEQNIEEDKDSRNGIPKMVEEGRSHSGAAGTNTARLRSRISLARAAMSTGSASPTSLENFRVFFHVLTQDHSLPDLIWNQQTRREMRIGLESEMQYIQRETEARGLSRMAWNHQQYGIRYPSLDGELRVGNVYMRLWLQAGDGFIKSWEEPERLFEQLFRRFLCEIDRNNKVTIVCIQCMERLYAIHGQKIGPFPDMMILIRSMMSTRSIETQHRLLGLLATILGVNRHQDDQPSINIPENAEQLLNAEAIGQLCQFVAWGHINGDQAGNLMTRVLKHSQRAMITDGETPTSIFSSETPVGASKSPSAHDALCPPVWFVSSTSKIPPPDDAVSGPFRVSELKDMVNAGRITPFTSVTSSHVEVYDSDELGAEGLSENKIDKGTWKRLDQVWQLRWQLCTDASDSGIFSPSEVALIALKSLTRLVDLHKSLDSRGLPFYPIPIAKRIICGLSRDPTVSSSGVGTDGKSALQRDDFLSIIAQSLLCNDPHVVSQGADLLNKLTLYNDEALAKFYLTGVFFFACSYPGSDFTNLARLLHATHGKQHFLSGFAAVASDEEVSLKERSILGSVLPLGLLSVLNNYGYERFSEIFLGNYDTPEVVWNFEMRKHLIEMIRQHLGDFPQRLWQNTTTAYEYCPIPGISYKNVEGEIFCHGYYLRNLCDETKFPGWPVSEPVEVFRSCLEHFKKNIDKEYSNDDETVETARKILNLSDGDGSKELRRSYRNLARKYHPDKNPGGRETFEKIQSSYELLLPLLESGVQIQHVTDPSLTDNTSDAEGFEGGLRQMRTLSLLIKAQALLYRRFEEEMSRYKYPSYGLLLSCLQLPESCRKVYHDGDPESLQAKCLMSEQRLEFTKYASQLVFQTCLVSPLNAEELVHEGGVATLEALMDFYVRCVRDIIASSGPNATDTRIHLVIETLTNIIHTIGGVCYYESGRLAVVDLPCRDRLMLNWRRCLSGWQLGKKVSDLGDSLIKKFSLEGLAFMAKDETLRDLLVGSGCLWPLVRNLLGFDPSLEVTGSVDMDDDVGLSQASSNTQARISARALGLLSGLYKDSKESSNGIESVSEALRSMLTPPIALLLRNKRTADLLQTLNSNIEKPTRIWNVKMRHELEVFLDHVEKVRPEDAIQDVDLEVREALSFVYAELKNELLVGGVYIRVFDKLGGDRTAIREIADVGAFVRQLMFLIGRSLDSNEEYFDDWTKLDLGSDNGDLDFSVTPLDVNDDRFVMCLSALRALGRIDSLVDDLLFAENSRGLLVSETLLGLLELPESSRAFEIGTEILLMFSPKASFADCVARSRSLWRLLVVLERTNKKDGDFRLRTNSEEEYNLLRRQRGWELLEALSSTASIADQLIESSGWIELLGILVGGYTEFTNAWVARVGAAKTLSRLLWDPKTGPRAGPLLERFLPPTLVVALKEDGPDAMLKLFDGESDTPELIWDAEMRTELRKTIGKELEVCLEHRGSKSHVADPYKIGPSVRVKFSKLENELYVGGVYVSRFLKEPTFSVRDPTLFLETLLQKWRHQLDLATSSSDAPAGDSHQLTTAGTDVLNLTTNACVYLCKTRPNLCDKLSTWGYMSVCLSFLEKIYSKGLTGDPLVNVMRLLHVAVSRRTNVESLIACGNNDTKHGVVAFTIGAIGEDTLHPDTSFFVEMLKNVFRDALGDLQKCGKQAKAEPTMPAYEFDYAMAPSPAPGEGPVSRNKVSSFDDPLAMLSSPSPAQSTNVTRPIHPSTTGFVANASASGIAYQSQQHPVPYQSQQQSSAYTLSQSYGAFQHANPHGRDNGAFPGHGQLGYSLTPGYSQPREAAPRSMQDTTLGPEVQSHSLYQPSTGRPHFAHSAPGPHRPTATSTVSQTHMTPSGGGAQASSDSFIRHQQQYHSRSSLTPPGTSAGVQFDQNGHQIPQGNWMFQHSQQAGHHFQQQPAGTSSYLQRSQFSRLAVDSHVKTNGQTHQPAGLQQQGQTAVENHGPPHGNPQTSGSSPQAISVAPVTHQNQNQFVGSISDPQTASTAPFSQQTQQGQGISGTAAEFRQTPLDRDSIQAQQITNPPNAGFQQLYAGSNNPGDPRATPSMNFTGVPNAPSHAPPPTQAPLLSPNGNYPPGTNQPGFQQVSSNVGTGIDARTKTDPKTEAEKRTTSVGGAPGAADGRIALLQSALSCKLPQFLVSLLENSSLRNVRDPASAKVHTVELLKLLTQDPAYGDKFSLILDDIPAWKKYKSQDHSLFITGLEQKADYFLTDGTSGEPTKLLTHE